MSCPLERLVSGLPSCLAQTPFYNRANEGNLAELDLLRTNEAVSASRNTHSADLLVLVGYFPNDADAGKGSNRCGKHTWENPVVCHVRRELCLHVSDMKNIMRSRQSSSVREKMVV